MKPTRTIVMTLSLTMLLLGCQSAPRVALPSSAEDNTTLLVKHPQFQAAAAAAPDFVKETFHLIHRLEKDKANGTH